MKYRPLSEKLMQLSIPEPDPTARSRALSHALIALKNREAVVPPVRELGIGRLLWPVSCVFLVILFFYASTAYWPGSSRHAPSDFAILNEMTALFENRLSGIVERGGKIDVQLAAHDVPVSRQPVRILMRRGHEEVRILSFSGREICLELDGQTTCVDVLATKDGEVILVGGGFFWDQQNRTSLAGYRIEATALTPAS